MLCLFDFKLVKSYFDKYIDWIKKYPQQGICLSVLLLTVSIVLTMPISYTIIMIGFTYAQVYNSQTLGFLVAVPIIYTGSMLGAMCAFLVSRYLLRDFINDQIKTNQWLFSNFKMIDEIVSTEGTKIVGLTRLTFAPFGITSYIFGVTDVPLSSYMLGNLSYIVNTCLHSFIGCSLYSGQTVGGAGGLMKLSAEAQAQHERMTKITLVVEITLTVAVTILIGYVAKNMLQQKMEEREEEMRKT